MQRGEERGREGGGGGGGWEHKKREVSSIPSVVTTHIIAKREVGASCYHISHTHSLFNTIKTLIF